MKEPLNKIILKILIFYSVITIISLLLFLQRSPNVFLSNPIRGTGLFAGILGTVFLSLNYITSARFRFIEKFTIGLDKVYRLHIFNGVFAYILILMHPLLLIWAHGITQNTFLSYFILSDQNSLHKNFAIVSFWLLSLLFMVAGLRKISYKFWVIIHSFIGLPFLFAAAHVYLVRVNNPSALTWWLGIWIALGIFSYIYKLFLYEYIGPVYKYKVNKINKTDELYELFLEPVSKKINYQPGQFVFLKIFQKDISSESHPYSISSSPTDSYLKLSIKKLGDWSSYLDNVKEGTICKIFGPYGHFYEKKMRDCKKMVWVGGGIGVAPFLSMAKSGQFKKSCEGIYLIYSDNNLQQAVFFKEVNSYAQNHPKFKVVTHLSDSEGFLTAEYIEQKVNGFEDTVFLLCGPLQMISSLRNQLLSKGVKDSDIVFEFFNFK